MVHRVQFTSVFWVGIACALLWLPFPWVTAWVAAVLVHELMHIFCMKILNVRITGMKLGVTGAIIDAEPCENWKRILCTFAGPLGGFALVILFPVAPKLAICALIQSLYNLLPVFEMDGKSIVACLLSCVFPEAQVKEITVWIEAIIIGVLIGIGIYFLLFYQNKVLSAAAVCILFWKYKKSLAKDSFRRYNRHIRLD